MRAIRTTLGLAVVSALASALVSCSTSHSGSDAAADAHGTWSRTRALPFARFEAAGAILGRRVLFVGGITGVEGDQLTARESDRVDMYDPSTGEWTLGPSLPTDAPKHHLAVAVGGDTLYVLGGFNGIIGGADRAGVFVPNAKSYALVGGSWRRLADQPIARGSATAGVLGAAIVVAGGGVTEPSALADVYAYDIATDTWSKRTPMPTAREHVASCVMGGKMLVAGGWKDDRTVVSTVEAYDPVTDEWTSLPPMPTARGGLGAAVLNGACFVVGGERWTGDVPGTFAANETFDPTSGKWDVRAPMFTARHGLGVVAFEGALWAIGGGPVRGNSYTDVVEVYRP